MIASLASRVEAIKLAAVLRVDADELDFLAEVDADTIRTMRTALGEALFARHEARFRKVAKLAAAVPSALSARIAQLALGPTLAARVAAVMDPAMAIKLAGSLAPDYLVEVSIALDPVRAEPILDGLPARTVVDVGQRLVKRGEHVTLGRFVSVIDPDIALQVVEVATGHDLVQVGLFADSPESLDVLVGRIDEALLIDAIRAAHERGTHADAITLVAQVSEQSRRRLVPLIVALDPDGLDRFVATIVEHDAWSVVLSALAEVDDDALGTVANVPAMLGEGVLDRAVASADALGLDDLVARLPKVLDEEHAAALTRA